MVFLHCSYFSVGYFDSFTDRLLQSFFLAKCKNIYWLIFRYALFFLVLCNSKFNMFSTGPNSDYWKNIHQIYDLLFQLLLKLDIHNPKCAYSDRKNADMKKASLGKTLFIRCPPLQAPALSFPSAISLLNCLTELKCFLCCMWRGCLFVLFFPGQIACFLPLWEWEGGCL